MELNWTTFSLEIINFLALLWILKRFLYQPVRATLAQRRAEPSRVTRDDDAHRSRIEMDLGKTLHVGRGHRLHAFAVSADVIEVDPVDRALDDLTRRADRTVAHVQRALSRPPELMAAIREYHAVSGRRATLPRAAAPGHP